MSHFRLSMLVTGLFLLINSPATAGEQERPQVKRERPAQSGDAGLQLVPPEVQERLRLSAEQKEKVAKLQQEFQDKNKDALAKIKDGLAQARQAQQKAREDKDRAAFRTASEQLQAQEQALRQLRTGPEAKLLEVLTPEQKQTYAAAKTGTPARPAVAAAGGVNQLLLPQVQERLGLTAEQKEKLAKLQQELETKLRGVLTEEQWKRFQEMNKRRPQPQEQPRQPQPRRQPGAAGGESINPGVGIRRSELAG